MAEIVSNTLTASKRARTYRVSPALVEQVDQLAREYGVGASRIVDLMLTVGLEQIGSGRRRLRRKAIRFDVELE
jgi:hypothetical protein